MRVLFLSAYFWTAAALLGSDAKLPEGLAGRLRLFKEKGFHPTSIIDAGANAGEWTELVRQVWPRSSYFIIEANPRYAATYKSRGWKHAIALLGDASKNVTMHMDKRHNTQTGNSIFPETLPSSQRFFVPKTMQMSTLDDILRTNGVPPPQLLKLDVQGAELLALAGAKQTLQSVEMIELELSVQPYNKGAPLWFEVHMILERLGYQLYDIPEVHYSRIWRNLEQQGLSGHLSQVDVIFVRKDSSLWSRSVTRFEPPEKWPSFTCTKNPD